MAFEANDMPEKIGLVGLRGRSDKLGRSRRMSETARRATVTTADESLTDTRR